MALVVFAAAIGGCNASNSITGVIGRPSANDFQKTEIIAQNSVSADGSTPLLVAIQLKNSNNKPVSDFLPTYEITSGIGVTAGQCTRSDSNGVSVCILKSVVAGSKTLRLTNAKIGLTKDVVFTAPTGTQKLEVVSSGLATGSTPQGSAVQVSVGHPLKGVRIQTSGGYQAIFSMQGVVTQ